MSKKSKFYDGHYSPFKDLKQKMTYIKRSGVSCSTMFTKKGNDEMAGVIQKVVDFILNEKRFNRKKIIRLLVSDWKMVHFKYSEAYDTDVKETVFWYLDACLEHRGKKEISFNELKDLYEEDKK
jgi:hypothetical protein